MSRVQIQGLLSLEQQNRRVLLRDWPGPHPPERLWDKRWLSYKAWKKKKKTIPKKFQNDMMTNMTYVKMKFVYK